MDPDYTLKLLEGILAGDKSAETMAAEIYQAYHDYEYPPEPVDQTLTEFLQGLYEHEKATEAQQGGPPQPGTQRAGAGGLGGLINRHKRQFEALPEAYQYPFARGQNAVRY